MCSEILKNYKNTFNIEFYKKYKNAENDMINEKCMLKK